ncbi:MAG: hypothetical protein H7A47_15520 [Verrucomicrobiales bacterium]|nr:hypothetical protein [Verrucomicrobiales bacterium]
MSTEGVKLKVLVDAMRAACERADPSWEAIRRRREEQGLPPPERWGTACFEDIQRLLAGDAERTVSVEFVVGLAAVLLVEIGRVDRLGRHAIEDLPRNANDPSPLDKHRGLLPQPSEDRLGVAVLGFLENQDLARLADAVGSITGPAKWLVAMRDEFPNRSNVELLCLACYLSQVLEADDQRPIVSKLLTGLSEPGKPQASTLCGELEDYCDRQRWLAGKPEMLPLTDANPDRLREAVAGAVSDLQALVGRHLCERIAAILDENYGWTRKDNEA